VAREAAGAFFFAKSVFFGLSSSSSLKSKPMAVGDAELETGANRSFR
jgi:hypothetical protein